jgi:AraC family transcriptional regulator
VWADRLWGVSSLNHSTATVHAQLRADVAMAQIVQFDMPEPIDHVMAYSDRFVVNMSLTPRPADACACYPERWKKDRFERIGEIFFVPPEEAIHVRSRAGSQTAIVCEIDPHIVTRWFDGEMEWNSATLESGLHISDRSIYGLLMRMTCEVNHPGFASEAMLELLVQQLAIELGRYCAAIKNVPPKNGLATWRLRIIDERVRQIGKAPSLSELAVQCDLSVRQLSRGFRTSRQCSIGDYIEQARIDNAKRLLAGGSSVKSVAYSVGFSSPSSFSFAFRRATGIAPMEYRQLV